MLPDADFFRGREKNLSVRPRAVRTPERAQRFHSPLSLQQSLLAFLCCLERVVSAAQTPSVRRVELGVGCVLSFLLVIREHAVLRRSLCSTLTALIDPLAAPSGAIADGLTPYPVLRAEVMWIGLLGLRLDRSGVEGRDPGTQRVQVRHRSRKFVRRELGGFFPSEMRDRICRRRRSSARRSRIGEPHENKGQGRPTGAHANRTMHRSKYQAGLSRGQFLSVECPFNKFYGINCRSKLGVKLLDRFFHGDK